MSSSRPFVSQPFSDWAFYIALQKSCHTAFAAVRTLIQIKAAAEAAMENRGLAANRQSQAADLLQRLARACRLEHVTAIRFPSASGVPSSSLRGTLSSSSYQLTFSSP
jgi:hypothetical protein